MTASEAFRHLQEVFEMILRWRRRLSALKLAILALLVPAFWGFGCHFSHEHSSTVDSYELSITGSDAVTVISLCFLAVFFVLADVVNNRQSAASAKKLGEIPDDTAVAGPKVPEV